MGLLLGKEGEETQGSEIQKEFRVEGSQIVG